MILKISHIADLHIGSHQYGIKQRKLNTYKTNIKLAKQIASESNLVIVAGDVFDSSEPSPDDIKCWIDMRTIWNNTNTKVIACTGNHDKTDSMCQWVELGDEESFGHESSINSEGNLFELTNKLDPLKIVWISHTKKSELKSRIQKIPDNLDIIVMHQSAGGFLPSIMRPELDEDDILALSKKCKYLALGDLHIHKKMVVGDCTVAYPGNTEFLRLCDTPNNFRYISLLFNTETNNIDSIKSVDFEPFQETTIQDYKSSEEAIKKILSSDNFNIFRYNPESSTDVNSLLGKLYNNSEFNGKVFYFHKNVKKIEKAPEDAEKLHTSDEVDFIELARSQKSLEDRDIKIIEDIWNSQPVLIKQVLMEDLKEQLNESIKSSS